MLWRGRDTASRRACRHRGIVDWLARAPANILHAVMCVGYWLMSVSGLPMTTEWVLTSLIIVLCAGSLWLPVLVLHKRL
ncbi:DUF2269 family protein [Pseudomonas sp. Irchel 3E19]|uniref:DUF2269 family protein n=1 Tax=Pseudomonas TaxID=286 RepID=UPI003530E599